MFYMTSSLPSSDFFISDEEFHRNAPTSPDTFRPRGPQLSKKYDVSQIIRTLSKMTRTYKTVPWKSKWSFGFDAQGRIIGERYSKRPNRWGKSVGCIIDTRTFSSQSELKAFLLDQHRIHWQIEQRKRPARPVRVCV